MSDEQPLKTPYVQAFIADNYGYVMSVDEAVAHVQEHIDRQVPVDEWGCDECPASLSLRRGSALPSAPDQDGLNSKMPSSWQTTDLILESERLGNEAWEDLVPMLEGFRTVVAALAENHPSEVDRG